MSDNAKKKKNPLILIVLVLLIVIIAGGGFIGYKLITKDKVQTPKVIEETTYSLDDFLVNTADTGSRRYIKTKIFLGFEDSKLSKELDTKKATIRDVVNAILYSKKASDLDEKGLTSLKSEIVEKVNKVLTTGQVKSVYYYDILLQ